MNPDTNRDTNRDVNDGRLHTDTTPWRVSFSRRLGHSPQRVWEAITDPEHLDAWFPTRVIGERVVGAPLRFEFREGEGDAFDGEMLVFDPPQDKHRWKPLFDHYVATFPPEASTIGPPEGIEP